MFHPAFPRCQDLKVSEDGKVQVRGVSSSTHMYHFNGNSKYKAGCSDYYRNGWFTDLEKPTEINAHVTLVGTNNEIFDIPVTEICPYIWEKNFTWLDPKKHGDRYGTARLLKINIQNKVDSYFDVQKIQKYDLASSKY